MCVDGTVRNRKQAVGNKSLSLRHCVRKPDIVMRHYLLTARVTTLSYCPGQDIFIVVSYTSQRQEDLKTAIPHLVYTPTFLSLTDL